MHQRFSLRLRPFHVIVWKWHCYRDHCLFATRSVCVCCIWRVAVLFEWRFAHKNAVFCVDIYAFVLLKAGYNGSSEPGLSPHDAVCNVCSYWCEISHCNVIWTRHLVPERIEKLTLILWAWGLTLGLRDVVVHCCSVFSLELRHRS